jgi:hypothetical protein
VVPPPFPGLGTIYPSYESLKQENGIDGVTHPLPVKTKMKKYRERI